MKDIFIVVVREQIPNSTDEATMPNAECKSDLESGRFSLIISMEIH